MTDESREDFEQFYLERFRDRIFAGTEFKKIASDIWESAQEVAISKNRAIIQQQVQPDSGE